MADEKNNVLFGLIDDLQINMVAIEEYAIGRTKSGNRKPNRLAHIEQHANAIELIVNQMK